MESSHVIYYASMTLLFSFLLYDYYYWKPNDQSSVSRVRTRDIATDTFQLCILMYALLFYCSNIASTIPTPTIPTPTIPTPTIPTPTILTIALMVYVGLSLIHTFCYSHREKRSNLAILLTLLGLFVGFSSMDYNMFRKK